MDTERLQAARRGFQGNLPAAVAELSRSGTVDSDSTAGGGGTDWTKHAAAGAVAGVAAAALFEELLPVAGGPITGGVLGSARLIQQVIAPCGQRYAVMVAEVIASCGLLCGLLAG